MGEGERESHIPTISPEPKITARVIANDNLRDTMVTFTDARSLD